MPIASENYYVAPALLIRLHLQSMTVSFLDGFVEEVWEEVPNTPSLPTSAAITPGTAKHTIKRPAAAAAAAAAPSSDSAGAKRRKTVG